jgi:hypothetical protein
MTACDSEETFRRHFFMYGILGELYITYLRTKWGSDNLKRLVGSLGIKSIISKIKYNSRRNGTELSFFDTYRYHSLAEATIKSNLHSLLTNYTQWIVHYLATFLEMC